MLFSLYSLIKDNLYFYDNMGELKFPHFMIVLGID